MGYGISGQDRGLPRTKRTVMYNTVAVCLNINNACFRQHTRVGLASI